jgi:transcriptional regulator with XRE-family HTH domain
MIGISNQALSAIERGKANPSKQTLISLAKTLKNDFGVPWLVPFVTEGDESLNPFSHRARTEPQHNPYLENILDDYEEFLEAAKLPKPVGIMKRKTAILPIHFEIRNRVSLTPSDDPKRVLVPFYMIPSLEKARAIHVIGEPIRDAFVAPGDIIILNENPEPEEGRVILALVKKRVVIGQWELRSKGKAILKPRDSNFKPTEVPLKQFECVGDLTGLIPAFQLTLDR